jgi:hypothetical protein
MMARIAYALWSITLAQASTYGCNIRLVKGLRKK